MRVGGNDGNPKKAESHLRRSESTQGAPGVQGGLFGVQEGAVGSQEVAGKWRCMNDFSQKVEDFSRFFEIGSFRPWRRRRWSRLAERSPKPVSPTKTDKGKWVSDDTRKIRRFSSDFPDQVSASGCGNGNERREKVYLVECERSGPHLEIPYLFLLADCECGARNA